MSLPSASPVRRRTTTVLESLVGKEDSGGAPRSSRTVLIREPRQRWIHSGDCDEGDLHAEHLGARRIGIKYRVTEVQRLDTKAEEVTLKFRVWCCWRPDASYLEVASVQLVSVAAGAQRPGAPACDAYCVCRRVRNGRSSVAFHTGAIDLAKTSYQATWNCAHRFLDYKHKEGPLSFEVLVANTGGADESLGSAALDGSQTASLRDGDRATFELTLEGAAPAGGGKVMVTLELKSERALYEQELRGGGLQDEALNDFRLFRPGVRFLNAKDESTLWRKMSLIRDQAGKVALVDLETLRCGTFSQPMRLKYFPFDRQVISIDGGLTAPLEEQVLVDYCGAEMSSAPGARKEAWRPRVEIGTYEARTDRIVIWSGRRMEYEEERVSGGSHAKFSIEIFYQRNPTTTISSVIFMIFILVSMSCSSLIEELGLNDRIQIVITMVLTVAAYKQVIQDELPNKPYLTFTDCYILAAFAFLAFVLLFLCLGFRAGLYSFYLAWLFVHVFCCALYKLYPEMVFPPWEDLISPELREEAARSSGKKDD